MDITVTFLGPGLASLPGCPGLSNPHPVVSLRSTTGYTLGCLRHSFEELTNDLSLYSGPPRSDGTQVGKNRNSSIVGEGNLLASLIVSAR
jgi:hypothetical protein